jgi:hypothetical protein
MPPPPLMSLLAGRRIMARDSGGGRTGCHAGGAVVVEPAAGRSAARIMRTRLDTSNLDDGQADERSSLPSRARRSVFAGWRRPCVCESLSLAIQIWNQFSGAVVVEFGRARARRA